MKAISTAFAVCAVTAAAACFAGTATAQPKSQQIHVMTVRLPDGSLEHIRYTGDQPPKVDFEGDGAPLLVMPMFDMRVSDSPFAELDRISAMMDRQAATMMRAASSADRAAFADPHGKLDADFANLPPGAQGYSVISTMSGNTVCTRSVRYLGSADGKAPRIQTSTSGNCGGGNVASKPLQAVAPKPAMRRNADVIEAGYHPGVAKSVPSPALVADAAD